MQSSSESLENKGNDNSLQQILESKLFSIIRDFSQFAKTMDEEQNNINRSMNNTIDTVNTLIDQLEENKSALLRAEREIENLKTEIQQIKADSPKSTYSVQSRSIPIASHYDPQDSSSNNINPDISSIKEELNNLKKNQEKYQTLEHDINCLKYEVKKVKSTCQVIIPETKSQNNAEIMEKLNNLKIQVEALKKMKSGKKTKFSFMKKKDKRISISEDDRVESKYLVSSDADETETTEPIKELETTIIDKLNTHQRDLESLKCDMKNISESNVSQESIKKIKRQIKKLKSRTEALENKVKQAKENSADEEKNRKENIQESPSESDTFHRNLNSDNSSHEYKTQEMSD